MSDAMIQALPVPQAAVEIRLGTLDDLPFIDALQKKHSKQVGWMPRQSLEGKILAGHVLVAEEGRGEATERRSDGGECGESAQSALLPSLRRFVAASLRPCTPIGYVISTDRYYKRDDVGIVYQMNVVPERRRSLVAATMLKAVFERAAYGCRLFCCWCAQDLEANRFWEAMGFVPLAYRAGSEKKGRVHIFWQRRIRAGDEETPYWFPSQTNCGSIREDRLVLPIPPGVDWREVEPILMAGGESTTSEARTPKQIQNQRSKIQNGVNQTSKIQNADRSLSAGGLRFAPTPPAAPAKPVREKPVREKVKADPKLKVMARELRDRWLEAYNSGAYDRAGAGKYNIARVIAAPAPAGRTIGRKTAKALLPAA